MGAGALGRPLQGLRPKKNNKNKIKFYFTDLCFRVREPEAEVTLWELAPEIQRL